MEKQERENCRSGRGFYIFHSLPLTLNSSSNSGLLNEEELRKRERLSFSFHQWHVFHKGQREKPIGEDNGKRPTRRFTHRSGGKNGLAVNPPIVTEGKVAPFGLVLMSSLLWRETSQSLPLDCEPDVGYQRLVSLAPRDDDQTEGGFLRLLLSSPSLTCLRFPFLLRRLNLD